MRGGGGGIGGLIAGDAFQIRRRSLGLRPSTLWVSLVLSHPAQAHLKGEAVGAWYWGPIFVCRPASYIPETKWGFISSVSTVAGAPSGEE